MKHHPAAFVRSLAFVALWAVVSSSCSERESPTGPNPIPQPLFQIGGSGSDGFFFISFTGSATATTTGSGVGFFFPLFTEFGTGPGSITDDTPEDFVMARGVGATKETRVAFLSGTPPCPIQPFAITESATGFSRAAPVLDEDGNPVAGKLSHSFTYEIIAIAEVNATDCKPQSSASGSVNSEVAGEYHVPAASDLVVVIEHDPPLAPPATPSASLTFELKNKATGEVLYSKTGGFAQAEEVTMLEVAGKELLWTASSEASASATCCGTGDSESGVWRISMLSKPTGEPTGEPPADVTPPTLVLPADPTVEAAGPDGAVVTFHVTATDDKDPSPAVSCNPPSGSVFPVGTTQVTCTAADVAGNSSTGTFAVNVVDTTPPDLTVPDPIQITAPGPVPATEPSIQAFLAAATASDLVDPSPAVTHDAPATFPVGTTVVTFTATDASGNTASGTSRVTVLLLLRASIDIKPGSDPNSSNCRNTRGLLPVAVLSEGSFDATTLDANTVRFGKTGTEAGEVHQNGGEATRHVEDVNGDGREDMVFHFRFGETGFGCSDIPAGHRSAEVTGQLTGSTQGGVPVAGKDNLRLVGG